MILRIKKNKIKNWEYSISNERGVCLGFYWKLVFSPYGQFHYYKLTRPNESGAIHIELRATDKESPRTLIENYIYDNHDKVIVEWIIRGYKENGKPNPTNIKY